MAGQTSHVEDLLVIHHLVDLLVVLGERPKLVVKLVQDLQRPRTDTEDPRSLPWRTKVSNACQTETAVSKNEPLTDKNAKDNMPIEPFQALGSKHGCETPNRSWSCS